MVPVDGIGDKTVTDVASHAESKHSVCVTSDGSVYAWGCGVSGSRVAHGDGRSCDLPTLVPELSGKTVVKVVVGGGYCAALTLAGQLFTWGSGGHGRLGHGNCDDVATPKQVSAFEGVKIADVSCGSGDAHTLAVTEAGR